MNRVSYSNMNILSNAWTTSNPREINSREFPLKMFPLLSNRRRRPYSPIIVPWCHVQYPKSHPWRPSSHLHHLPLPTISVCSKHRRSRLLRWWWWWVKPRPGRTKCPQHLRIVHWRLGQLFPNPAAAAAAVRHSQPQPPPSVLPYLTHANPSKSLTQLPLMPPSSCLSSYDQQRIVCIKSTLKNILSLVHRPDRALFRLPKTASSRPLLLIPLSSSSPILDTTFCRLVSFWKWPRVFLAGR